MNCLEKVIRCLEFFLMSGKQNYLQKSLKFPSEQLIECPKKDKMSGKDKNV